MLTTIAIVYGLLSILASILLLAALMLSSKISQREQLVESTVFVKESQPNVVETYLLEN